MTALIQATRRHLGATGAAGLTPGLPAPTSWRGPLERAAPLAALAVVALLVPGGPGLLMDALAEAYLAVAVFVAGTLLLVNGLERGLGTDLGAFLRRNARWQVPIAALLGAFPGCGGAIVALTQFTRGHLSLGGVVATLTATMGDAMFLLLARAPGTAALVLSVSVVVGILTGWLVDRIHGLDFLRPTPDQPDAAGATDAFGSANRVGAADGSLARGVERAWVWLLVPGLAAGLLLAFQIDLDAWLGPALGLAPVHALGVAGAGGALLLWVLRGRGADAGEAAGEAACRRPGNRCVAGLDMAPVVATTSFITAWVVVAFALYELAVAGLNLDLGAWLQAAAPLVPGIAVLVGLIPGCGPQIVVTTLYLSGVAPLSAQLGNAIANDGDALFPAIAVAPRAALVATVYSAFPALVVGYGTFWLMGA